MVGIFFFLILLLRFSLSLIFASPWQSSCCFHKADPGPGYLLWQLLLIIIQLICPFLLVSPPSAFSHWGGELEAWRGRKFAKPLWARSSSWACSSFLYPEVSAITNWLGECNSRNTAAPLVDLFLKINKLKKEEMLCSGWGLRSWEGGGQSRSLSCHVTESWWQQLSAVETALNMNWCHYAKSWWIMKVAHTSYVWKKKTTFK